MKKRTLAREFALQILYQIDIGHEGYEEVLKNFWQSKLEEEIEEEVKEFSASLVKGTVDNLAPIDEKITQFATNWQLERMAFVDRNILRLGVFELVFRSDIPPKVTINEAVELAKKFSGKEAGKFVNGILDKIKIEIKK
ncbi:MAG: transcription antitermination factor NusB [Candidatus Omnitrophica bacterium]|nr:transcription antitermination factor NusB [Candidatus Omnitrophota bacterium]